MSCLQNINILNYPIDDELSFKALTIPSEIQKLGLNLFFYEIWLYKYHLLVFNADWELLIE